MPDTEKNEALSGVEVDALVRLRDVIAILLEYTDLKGLEFLQNKTPTHGPCCACQSCGHWYDDCVCTHNEILQLLHLLEKY